MWVRDMQKQRQMQYKGKFQKPFHLPFQIASCFKSGVLALALCVAMTSLQPAYAQYSDDKLYRDVNEMDDRLKRLERMLKDVEREVYSIRKKGKYKGSESSNAAPGTASTVRLDELESLIRQLNGVIEQTRFENQQLQAEVQKWSGDVDFRLRAIEEKLGISTIPNSAPSFNNSGPSGPNAPVNPNAPASTLGDRSDAGDLGRANGTGGIEDLIVPEGLDENLAQSMGVLGETAPSAALPDTALPPDQSDVPTVSSLGTPDPVTVEGGEIETTIKSVGPETYASIEQGALPSSPGALFQHAYNRLISRDFVNSQEAFRVFLELYPDHTRAGEAQYWLGESFYAQGSYKNAGQQFAQGLSKYPQSPKAPETLLKLGMSFIALGETKAGCKSFSEMRSRFPSVEEALAQRADRERQRAGCS